MYEVRETSSGRLLVTFSREPLDGDLDDLMLAEGADSVRIEQVGIENLRPHCGRVEP